LNLDFISTHDAGTTAADTMTTAAVTNDYLSGQAGNDTISGGAGYDLIRGDDGNDSISGGADGDRVFGGDGTDILNGDAGNDELYGDAGSDTIDGGTGADLIQGGADADSITGGLGADTIYGGGGNDTMTGSVEANVVDTFRWEFADAGSKGLPAVDTINGFDDTNVTGGGTVGGDVLDLRDLLVGEDRAGLTGGNLDDFLHFSITGGTTRVHISASGDFSASYSPTREVQTIVLQGVDLVDSRTTDLQIIQDLLTRGKLVTD
jgi:Ca2+-binding RTX toxin-like protein